MAELINSSLSSAVVAAVSGGVDSVVLLHELNRLLPAQSIVVAHVNHGVRDDAAADARFVAALAAGYGNRFEQLILPPNKTLSEAAGRQARYDFFAGLAERYGAQVATAHHADDLVETVAINLLRGTGWRGLAVLGGGHVWRPLLDYPKTQLYEHALRHRLEWVEDATNQTDAYLRNRVRRRLLPQVERRNRAIRHQLRELRDRQLAARQSIEQIMSGLPETPVLPLAWLAHDAASAREILRLFLRRHGIRQTWPQIDRALDFARTAGTKKRFSLDARHFLQRNRDGLVVVSLEN